jgi:hypothetical protein
LESFRGNCEFSNPVDIRRLRFGSRRRREDDVATLDVSADGTAASRFERGSKSRHRHRVSAPDVDSAE